MASWTNEIWQHTETMFEHGTEACTIPRNTLFIKCGKTAVKAKPRNDVLRNPGKPYQVIQHGLNANDVIKAKIGNGMFLYPKKRTLNVLKRSSQRLLDTVKSQNENGGERIFDSSLRPYSEAGRLVYSLISNIMSLLNCHVCKN